MNCTATNLSYQQTGYFSNLTTDYLNGEELLTPFYKHPVSIEGIQSVIHDRERFKTPRTVLVEALNKQYSTLPVSKIVRKNIESLCAENTFTITTAHQPAIFTGTLFFIYKILHAIKMASQLSKELPGYNFVPVYYMGSEDADLEELGKVFFEGEKIVWDTKQTGAVGRMNTKGIEKIITKIEGEFS